MKKSGQPIGYTIPIIDLHFEIGRQIIVDKEQGRYLGHPTTVLLEDNRTMFAVYPMGHGRGPIVMKKSTDGGLTWGNRLTVPENWSTSLEVPTIYRMVDNEGTDRLIMFSGLYPIRMAFSENKGEDWTPLHPIGDFGGIVAMSDAIQLKDGSYMALFHDDGRYLCGNNNKKNNAYPVFKIYKTMSKDGGLSWSGPEVITEHPSAHLCEPCIFYSPESNKLAVVMRENSRKYNSFVIFSDDEGKTWSAPRELPAALTGDRHKCLYAPDGRLVFVFRDTARETATRGDFVAWVGTFDDIAEGRDGQYRVWLLDNKLNQHNGNDLDCGYPGLELLPDGTFIATTYGHWLDEEEPFIVSVRFKMEELDCKWNS